MARLVEEIMNRELFTARPEDPADQLIQCFSMLGISASPVLQLDGGLVGMITLRDLVRADPNTMIADLMSTPVISVGADSSIEEAARILGESGMHRLPVVDDQRVVGIVSSLDVIRGLTGIPTQHPEVFPHFDEETGLIWTDDAPLEMDRVERASLGPGLVAIVNGGVGVEERVVWAERTDDMRARLIEIISTPQFQPLGLRHWLTGKVLRFRSASLSDKQLGRRIVNKIQRGIGYSHH